MIGVFLLSTFWLTRLERNKSEHATIGIVPALVKSVFVSDAQASTCTKRRAQVALLLTSEIRSIDVNALKSLFVCSVSFCLL